MAESSLCSVSSDPEISSLKEALRAHQKLLQNLYIELEEEREASATAASETLSFILRIQAEKAAVKMEANQYKRIAEEKICHFEESMAIFEDLVCQQEVEISALEFQVQCYRCRLLSFGFSDPGLNDCLRTVKSLPPIQLNDSYLKKNCLKMKKYLLPRADFDPNFAEEAAEEEESYGLEKKSGERHDFYLEQVTKLQDYDQIKLYEKEEASGLSEIQDIYEVPSLGIDQSKLIIEDECRFEKPDSVFHEISVKNFDVRWKKRRNKKMGFGQKHENMGVESEFEELCERIEEFGAEKYGKKEEISEEEVKLLKEINQKLDFIQSEMTVRRRPSKSPQLEFSLLTLTEAMLYFWL